MKRLLLVLLAFSLSSWATLPQTVRWNVERTTGAADTNGGGFDTAKAGTDYSQSVNNGGSCLAKLHIDGSTITATANAATVTFTGNTYTVSTADYGNLIHIVTVSGWFEITTGTPGLNGTWTLERSTGMSGGTITGDMGGCLASPQQALTNMGSATPSAIDQASYVKAGTSAYNLTQALTIPSMAAAGKSNTRLVGYATSQEDRGLLAVSAASNAAATVFTVTGHLLGTSGTIPLCDVKGGTGSWAAINGVRTITLLAANTFSVPVDSTSFGAMTGTITVSVRPLFSTNGGTYDGLDMTSGIGWHFENFILDGTGYTGTPYGIHITDDKSVYINTWVRNFQKECISSTGQFAGLGIEVSGCGGTAAQISISNITALLYSYVHNSASSKSGAILGGYGAWVLLIGNVFANNSGASADGVQLGGYPMTLLGNLFYGNGRHGLYLSGDYVATGQFFVYSNRFEYNGIGNAGSAYGLDVAPALPWKSMSQMDYNSYWGNKTAAVNSTITQGSHDVNASVDPSVAANNGTITASPNFSLNSSATGGALLRSTGSPGLLPGLGSSIGYADIGPLRHADPASSAGGSGSYSWVK